MERWLHLLWKNYNNADGLNTTTLHDPPCSPPAQRLDHSLPKDGSSHWLWVGAGQILTLFSFTPWAETRMRRGHPSRVMEELDRIWAETLPKGHHCRGQSQHSGHSHPSLRQVLEWVWLVLYAWTLSCLSDTKGITTEEGWFETFICNAYCTLLIKNTVQK